MSDLGSFKTYFEIHSNELCRLVKYLRKDHAKIALIQNNRETIEYINSLTNEYYLNVGEAVYFGANYVD